MNPEMPADENSLVASPNTNATATTSTPTTTTSTGSSSSSSSSSSTTAATTAPETTTAPAASSKMATEEKGEADEEAEEVTETKIIGVTETGVIRKRSFKRKVTKEEKSSRRGFGQDKEAYKKIVARVMSERLISGTLEGLHERWKMISYMHDDCMDMVAQWDKARQEKLQARRRKEPLLYLVAGCASACVLGVLWWLGRCVL